MNLDILKTRKTLLQKNSCVCQYGNDEIITWPEMHTLLT